MLFRPCTGNLLSAGLTRGRALDSGFDGGWSLWGEGVGVGLAEPCSLFAASAPAEQCTGHQHRDNKNALCF